MLCGQYKTRQNASSEALQFLHDVLALEKEENDTILLDSNVFSVISNNSNHCRYFTTTDQRREMQMAKLEQERTDTIDETMQDVAEERNEELSYIVDHQINTHEFDGKQFEDLRITVNDSTNDCKFVNVYFKNEKLLKIYAMSVSKRTGVYRVEGKCDITFTSTRNASGKFCRIVDIVRDGEVLISALGYVWTEMSNYRQLEETL